MTTKESDVDVLAVIAKHRDSHQALSESDAYSAQEYPRLRDACAAVAELIEASADLEKAVREETEHLKASAFHDISECDTHRTFENRVTEATDRLRTALHNAGVKV